MRSEALAVTNKAQGEGNAAWQESQEKSISENESRLAI